MYRANYTTLDFVIQDYKAVMCLLHFLHCVVHKPDTNDFMKIYKQLKFKMKLQYEAWSRNIETQTLIHYAILKATHFKMRETTRELQAIVQNKSLNEQHRLYSQDTDSVKVTRQAPNK